MAFLIIGILSRNKFTLQKKMKGTENIEQITFPDSLGFRILSKIYFLMWFMVLKSGTIKLFFLQPLRISLL